MPFERVAAIIMIRQFDDLQLKKAAQALRQKVKNIRILVATSSGSESTSTFEDQMYLIKLEGSKQFSEISSAVKQALALTPESAGFFIFHDSQEAEFSDTDLKKIVRKNLDFHRARSGSLFLSSRYAASVSERGTSPSTLDAIDNGFSSEMGIFDMIRSPKAAIHQNWTLAKFAMVGVSGIGVNLLALTVFKFAVGALIANGIAQELSIISNFVWNDRFTFVDEKRPVKFFALSRFYRLVKYNLVSLFSFGINEFVFYIAYSNFHIFYITSSLLAIATAFVINYFGSSRWAWAKSTLQLAKD